MRCSIFLTLLLTSTIANAMSRDEVGGKCIKIAAVYQFAAMYHLQMQPTTTALKSITSMEITKGMQIQSVKNIINEVYFKPEFEGVDPHEINQAIYMQCANPPPEYKPL